MIDAPSRLQLTSLDEFGNRLIFVADGKLEAGLDRLADECQCVAMDACIIEVLDGSVPVKDNAIDARKFHQESVVFDHVRVARIVRSDQWMIMRRDRGLARLFAFGIKRSHRPVPAPVRAEWLGLIPGHVVGHDVPPAIWDCLTMPAVGR